jgi:peptidoglycan/xylan/chitin deacetylase (PgdA/CDA1 family)
VSYLLRSAGFDTVGRRAGTAKAQKGRDVHRLNRTIIWAGLETLYYSGTHHLARPFLSGMGTILTFHHVRPQRRDSVQLNDLLEITPEFLDEAVGRFRDEGFEIISLDEVHRRLTEGDPGRRFVALTFDDGYRDNLEYAYPVLKRHEAPFTLYVPSGFADGEGELWWVALERVVEATDRIELVMGDERRVFECGTPLAKDEVSETIYWWLRSFDDEDQLRGVVRDLAKRYGVDMCGICRELCLNWDELEGLARDPLVTIGSHTHSHLILRKASARVAEAEMRLGAARIEQRLGRAPQHFSFPFGDQTAAGQREFALAESLGFKTAVTTRPGVIFPDHARHLTALPRISVNGRFQKLRYLDVLLSGAPTALANGFRKVDAA